MKNAKVYQEILDAVTVEVWGREKKYADKNWHRYFRRSYISCQRPGVKYLNEKDYALLSFKAKKYFRALSIKRYYRYETTYFCTFRKHYFQVAYRRAYIISRKIISPNLEKRSQEIMEILDQPELYKFSKYNNGNYRYYFNPHKRLRRITKMTTNKMGLDNLEEFIYPNQKYGW